MVPHEDRFTPSTRGRAWNKLEFSNDGKHLLIGTDFHGHFLLDAFEGDLKAFLVGKTGVTGRAAPVSNTGKPLGQGDVCFTPDGRYVIGGAGDQSDTLVWDIFQTPDSGQTLQPLTRLPHRGKAAIVQLNPRYNMFASADKEIVFWLPDDSAKQPEK